MISALKRPIKSLPCATVAGLPASDVEIKAVPMTRVLIATWEKEVQTWIDLHYQCWSEGIPETRVRADVDWRWRRYYALAALQGVMPGDRSGKALAWCIVVTDDRFGQFPIGMLTVVPKFYSNVKGFEQHRIFTWFLADAPAEIYDEVLKMERVRGVATALIDTAIQSG